MNPWIIVLIIVASAMVFLLLLCEIVGFGIAKYGARPKCMTREGQKKMLEEMLKEKGIDYPVNNESRTDIEFVMKDGAVLHGDYTIKDPKKFVILAHGHHMTREGARNYALVLNELGWSTVIYDERGEGDNKRENITLGDKESRDLVEIIHRVKEKFGKDITLGLHGTSMGGAVVLLSLQYHPEVDFLIVDCGYARMEDVLKDLLKKMHLPLFLMGFIKMNLWVFYHESLKNAAPVEHIADNKLPGLFIHGSLDRFVFPYHTDLNYEAMDCFKKKVFFENAHHAESVYLYREEYKKEEAEFLREISGKMN